MQNYCFGYQIHWDCFGNILIGPQVDSQAKLLSVHEICWDFLCISNSDCYFGTYAQALNGFIVNLGLLFLVANYLLWYWPVGSPP